MFDPLLIPELQEMLIENDAPAMREFCDVFHAGVIAENLESLPVNECWRVLSEAEWSRRAEVFKYFGHVRQMELVETLDKAKVSALLEAMASGLATVSCLAVGVMDCLRHEENGLLSQPGDVPATYADVDDLMRDVGFRPSTSIEDGVSRFVSWYKSYRGT